MNEQQKWSANNDANHWLLNRTLGTEPIQNGMARERRPGQYPMQTMEIC
jgi:hypothetical protein